MLRVLFVCSVFIAIGVFLPKENLSTPAARRQLWSASAALAGGADRSSKLNRLRPSKVKLRIRGIGLGSTLNQVLHRFGMPKSRRQESISDTTCGPSYTQLSLDYSGLRFRLEGSLEGSRFRVVSVQVSNSRWIVLPALRVGMKEDKVRRKLGVPAGESDEAGFHRLHYVNRGNDGFAVFHFREGTLTKIEWEKSLC